MIDFIIKSTVSLGILYLFYILVLSRIKTFKFNRYFLLGSLVFSLVIPFISISIDTTVLPLPDAVGVLLIPDSIEQTNVFVNSNLVRQEESLITIQVLFFLYLVISGVLLLRFCSNLFNIIKTIRDNQKEKKRKFTMVLIKEKVLPHTFFNYILVNGDDFHGGRIDIALIDHEVAHCNQWHSIDILFIELIKVILWINPFIWLMKKPIQVNHEYLADYSVLANHNISKYQNTLINTVLTNNAPLLVSNFNFSFTKQRLKMMTKQFSQPKALFGKIVSIFTFILIALTISCNQEKNEQNSITNLENERWQPILNVHDINPTAYYEFENIFEMGSANIFLKSNEGHYTLKSLIYRDIDINTIYAKNAYVKFYGSKDSDKASEVVSAPLSMEFMYYQNWERKIRNATKMERRLNMNEEN